MTNFEDKVSFSFNFSIEEDDDENEEHENAVVPEESNTQIRPAEEVLLTEEHIRSLQNQIIPNSQIDIMPFIRNKEQLSIKKLTIKAENQLNTDQCSFVDDLKKTDLITGVYEGGFKLWECSIDLVQYLIDENVSLDGKSVLEVGCGHGLPGIFCSLVGKDTTVHYQDYNEEVIRFLTMPNVLLNDCTKSSAFFAGDWSLLEKYLEERGEKYDLILTSDTLYSTQYHQRLYSFMKKLLKPDGEILVAAKTYYFGCGGGVRQFEEMVNKKNEMEISVARKFTDGQSNMREILKMKHK